MRLPELVAVIHRCAGMRQSKLRIECNRLGIELIDCGVIFGGRRFRILLIIESSEINDVSVWIVGRLRSETCLFRQTQLCLELRRDLGSELSLESNRIGDGAVVTLRPDVAIIARVDQLHANKRAITVAPYRPFQNMIHSERLRDLPQIWVVPRYCMTEVRLMTFKSAILLRLVS